MDRTNKILIIVTNAGEYETVGMRTGLWLGELTHFYDYVQEKGYEVDIASPAGGFVPLDPESLAHEVLGELGTDKRYHDRDFMDLLENTTRAAEVNVEDYDAIYFTGGHGVMFDFRGDDLGALTARFYETDRVVSAVCHGPAALLNVPLSGGEPLVKGKNVSGFSWPEEEAAQRDDAVPFSLQDELTKFGVQHGRQTVRDPRDRGRAPDHRAEPRQRPGRGRNSCQPTAEPVSGGHRQGREHHLIPRIGWRATGIMRRGR